MIKMLFLLLNVSFLKITFIYRILIPGYGSFDAKLPSESTNKILRFDSSPKMNTVDPS